MRSPVTSLPTSGVVPIAVQRFMRGCGLSPLATALLCAGLLAGCSPLATTSPTESTASVPQELDLPPMKRFSALPVTPVARSNQDIARDFLDLYFQLETGAELAVFTRFEGPVSLRVVGERIPASLGPDLDDLLKRLRREANLSITRVDTSADARSAQANITVQTVSQNDLQSTQANAACLVVPYATDWQSYKRARRAKVSWAELTQRETLSIFLPNDVSAQEIRDCLHEEIAQALGPLNDLYRLPDSVFNDDNVHSVLTGFDMLTLRVAYAPELRSGMRRADVARVLPKLLTRLNPAGDRLGSLNSKPSPRDWIEDIVTATGAGASRSKRLRAAERAVVRAEAESWSDNRTGLAYFLLGRLTVGQDFDAAQYYQMQAHNLYSARSDTRFHAAQTALQLANFALVRNDYTAALEITLEAEPAAFEAGNAQLLGSLMMNRATALAALGRTSDARSVWLDSLGWARYGFATDTQVRTRAKEIAALARR